MLRMTQIDDPERDGTPSSSIDAAAQGSGVGSGSNPTKLQQSYVAFLHDLSSLLGPYAGQWVAYAGHLQLAIGPSKRELFRQCLAAGHRADEILICGIEQPRENVLDEL